MAGVWLDEAPTADLPYYLRQDDVDKASEALAQPQGQGGRWLDQVEPDLAQAPDLPPETGGELPVAYRDTIPGAPTVGLPSPQASSESDKPWHERLLGGAHLASPEEFAQRSGVIPNPGATVDAVKDFLFSPESAQAMRKTLAGFVPHSAMQAAELATPVVGAGEAILDASKRVYSAAQGEPLPQEKKFPEFTKQDWYDFGMGNAGQLVMAWLTGKGLVGASALKGAAEGPVREPGSPVARPEAKAEPPPVQPPEASTDAIGERTYARFQPPETTADVTRSILDRRKILMEEAGQLQAQAEISRQAGGRVHPAIEDRLSEINSELNRPSIHERTPPDLNEPPTRATVPPDEQTRQTAESPVSTTPGDITPGQQPVEAARPVSLVARSEIGAAGQGERPNIGISQARTEAELGQGSVEPGAGAEMGSGLDFGRDYINRGGDPRLPIRRAVTSGLVGKDEVGIVHAELERLRGERSAAATALEQNPGDPTAQASLDAADSAQRAWRKELQPVLTKASDTLREAYAQSVPDADPATYQGLADLFDEHFKGQRDITPQMRTEMTQAAKGVRHMRAAANGEMLNVEKAFTKRMGSKKVMSPAELDADLRSVLEDKFKDCFLA